MWTIARGDHRKPNVKGVINLDPEFWRALCGIMDWRSRRDLSERSEVTVMAKAARFSRKKVQEFASGWVTTARFYSFKHATYPGICPTPFGCGQVFLTAPAAEIWADFCSPSGYHQLVFYADNAFTYVRKKNNFTVVWNQLSHWRGIYVQCFIIGYC